MQLKWFEYFDRRLLERFQSKRIRAPFASTATKSMEPASHSCGV